MKQNIPGNGGTLLHELSVRAKTENFHQIDKAIPLSVQKYFYRMRNVYKACDIEFTPRRLRNIEILIYDKRMGRSWFRHTLVQLSIAPEIRAYRILEDFLQVAPPSLYHWASLAEFNARIDLEASLSDEKPVTVITSGLGGRDNMMRFSAMGATVDNLPLESYQRNLIENELRFALEEVDGVLEKISFEETAFIFSFLAPFDTNFVDLLRDAFTACNEVKNFVDIRTLSVTNEKHYAKRDVVKMLRETQKEEGE